MMYNQTSLSIMILFSLKIMSPHPPHPSYQSHPLTSQLTLPPTPYPPPPSKKTKPHKPLQTLLDKMILFLKNQTELQLQQQQQLIRQKLQTLQTKNTMYHPFKLSLLSFPLLLIMLLSTNQHAAANMNPNELETLFKIMESMSNDQNWRTSHPNPCQHGSSWLGIECKKNSNLNLDLDDTIYHVTRLDFGTYPNPTCKKTATFPSLIFQLPNLESVFFIHCFTHTHTKISIQETSSVSVLLQQLSLRSNLALIGTIPPQISSLKSLQILTLSQNSLVGEIPEEIFGLSSLVHLDLSYNNLTGKVPNLFSSLKNLVGLDLSYNKLTGPIPDTIGQLSTLQKLDLSSNSFTGKIPGTIESLQSLNFLALSNNKLSGNFPKGLKKLKGLQYFLMDDNPMYIKLPEELSQLEKIQELRLGSSGYSGEIPSSYSNLLNLTTLSLQNNRLTGEIPVEFSRFSHMYHLNLSRNLLSGVVPLNSSFLKRLGRNLDLSGNPGLCLNQETEEEANGILDLVGVNVCGSKNNSSISSITMPFENKSEASCGVIRFLFVLCVLLWLCLYPLEFLFV